MSTPAQVLANRANAEHSTGPVTPEGKAKASLNAVKTGLTSSTVILTAEDAPIYQQHVTRFVARFEPATDDEKTLVQFLADCEWRLLAIAPLEAGIKAIGRRALSHEFADEPDPAIRESLLLAQISMTYRRDLHNLGLQERRLRNQFEADLLKLTEMQKARKTEAKLEMERAVSRYQVAQRLNIPFDPAFFGFVFSTQEVIDHIDRNTAMNYLTGFGPATAKDQAEAYFAAWRKNSAQKQAA